jgi:hypothetical protein
VLSVCALIVFTIFCFSVDAKINLKFEVAPLKLFTNFENPSLLPVIRFKGPNAAILTLKMLQEAAFDSVQPEAACDKLILAHFPCSQ